MPNLGKNELNKGQTPLKLIRIHPLFAIFEDKNVQKVINLIDFNKTN